MASHDELSRAIAIIGMSIEDLATDAVAVGLIDDVLAPGFGAHIRSSMVLTRSLTDFVLGSGSPRPDDLTPATFGVEWTPPEPLPAWNPEIQVDLRELRLLAHKRLAHLTMDHVRNGSVFWPLGLCAGQLIVLLRDFNAALRLVDTELADRLEFHLERAAELLRS